MNTLLREIVQWMHNNNYRRASFDRLVGIIPSAATYEQLSSLLLEYPMVFRPATIKGGLPGLALRDEVDVANLLDVLGGGPEEEHFEVTLTSNLAAGSPPAAEPAVRRVTAVDVEQAIRCEYYLNAGEALGLSYGPTTLLTLCVLVLDNDFTIVGKSACVDPANYSASIGRTLAREDAIRQVWPFLGFRLADTLPEAPVV